MLARGYTKPGLLFVCAFLLILLTADPRAQTSTRKDSFLDNDALKAAGVSIGASFFVITADIVGEFISEPRWNPEDKRLRANAAAVRSMMFPGWGQHFNGHETKAATYWLLEGSLIGGAIWADRKGDNEYEDSIQTGGNSTDYYRLRDTLILSAALVWTYNIFDAYTDANMSDFDDDPFEGMGYLQNNNKPFFTAGLRDDGIIFSLNFNI